MKKLIYIGIILLMTVNMIACSNNAIIAKVNDTDISMDEYKKIESFLDNIGVYSKDDSKAIDDSILAFIIDNEIVYQVAKEKGFEASSEELNSKLDILKSNLSDEKLDEEIFKSQMEKDIIINKYKSEYFKNVIISDKEMNSYFHKNKKEFEVEEVRASQILISTLDDDNNIVDIDKKDKLKKKSQNILKKIKNKEEKFENIAVKYSDDKSSGKNGGDLGYFSRDGKNSEFTKVVFNLEKDKISDVFETSYGYHIVKITDKRVVNKTFEESKEKIKENLMIKKYIKHVDSLYKDAKITIT